MKTALKRTQGKRRNGVSGVLWVSVTLIWMSEEKVYIDNCVSCLRFHFKPMLLICVPQEQLQIPYFANSWFQVAALKVLVTSVQSFNILFLLCWLKGDDRTKYAYKQDQMNQKVFLRMGQICEENTYESQAFKASQKPTALSGSPEFLLHRVKRQQKCPYLILWGSWLIMTMYTSSHLGNVLFSITLAVFTRTFISDGGKVVLHKKTFPSTVIDVGSFSLMF